MRALLIVIMVFTVLLLIPVGIDGGYNGKKLILGIRVGLLNIRIFPQKNKPHNLKVKKNNVFRKLNVKKANENKDKTDKKQKLGLIKLVLRTLARLKRKLRVDYLRLHYTFATNDPFKTAMGFGISSSTIGIFYPLVESAFIIKDRDISTYYDFCGDRPKFDCWITMSIQIWEVFYIAAAFGIDYLKHKRENRKRKD